MRSDELSPQFSRDLPMPGDKEQAVGIAEIAGYLENNEELERRLAREPAAVKV